MLHRKGKKKKKSNNYRQQRDVLIGEIGKGRMSDLEITSMIAPFLLRPIPRKTLPEGVHCVRRVAVQ